MQSHEVVSSHASGRARWAQVLGGSYLGRYVSERTVQYVGGTLFLLFAAATVVDVVRGLQP